MASQPKRVHVKVLDADTGKELSSHEVSVAGLAGSCCCCTTTHPPRNGPPQEM